MERYRNRKDAGDRLAEALAEYRGKKGIVVLGLPRGGVPVAERIAKKLEAPLGIFIVRKLGVPGHRELAMGAIGSGGVRVLNESIVRSAGISEADIEKVEREERKKLEEREKAYRGDRPDLALAGKMVILVDDGIATGATIRVAVKALRQHDPRKLVVAVPVAPPETCGELAGEVDELICPLRPLDFAAVGQWYEDFGQTSDEEVRDVLRRAGR